VRSEIAGMLYDYLWSVVAVVAIVVLVAALRRWSRVNGRGVERALWLLVILAVPVAGPAVYLTLGPVPTAAVIQPPLH
jgi:hypothetical protein